MKPPAVPRIGDVENERIEFKSAAVLRDKDLSGIGREVVAFLNARGGTLWIGIGEDKERATTYESVGDAISQSRRVHDYLCDSVEPRPNHAELRITTATAPTGAELIALRATPSPERKPYALLAKNSRSYLVRVGARIRRMERDEIAAAFSGVAGGEERVDPLMARVRKALKPLRITEQPRLAMAIAPRTELELDLESLRALVADPSLSGNRHRAFTVFTEQSEPTVAKGLLESGMAGSRSLRVQQSGLIVFEARGSFLLEGYRGTKVYPYAVVEIPTSFLRLARHMYRSVEPDDEDEFVFTLSIEGIQSWRLPPHSPFSVTALFVKEGGASAHADIGVSPQTWVWKELNAADDRLALSVVRQIYSEFGLTERDVPSEFDSATGLLRLPN